MGGFLFSRARAHTHTLTHTHTLPTNKHQRASFNRSHRLASHLAGGSETDAFLYDTYLAGGSETDAFLYACMYHTCI